MMAGCGLQLQPAFVHVMNESPFSAALGETLNALRARLIADVAAKAHNESTRGGIRAEWRAHVERLARLRQAAGASGQPHQR